MFIEILSLSCHNFRTNPTLYLWPPDLEGSQRCSANHKQTRKVENQRI